MAIPRLRCPGDEVMAARRAARFGIGRPTIRARAADLEPGWSYIEVGEGTHTVMLEKNRMQLFRPVQAFLDEPAP